MIIKSSPGIVKLNMDMAMIYPGIVKLNMDMAMIYPGIV